MAKEAVYIDLVEGSAPATPATGRRRVYAKTDGIYEKDDAGTEEGLNGTGAASSFSQTTVRSSGNQNVSGSGTATDISWDTEVEDDDGLWAIGDPTDFNIPSALNGRRVQAMLQIAWTASSNGDYRQGNILLNGNTIASVEMSDVANTLNVWLQVITRPFVVATADVIKFQMRANATGIGLIGHATFPDGSFASLWTVD